LNRWRAGEIKEELKETPKREGTILGKEGISRKGQFFKRWKSGGRGKKA